MMTRRSLCRLTLCLSPLLATAARADVKLPAIFSDNMCLQQSMKVPVWGTASPGEKVTVTFAGQDKSATADDKGHWRVDLGDLKASDEPAELKVAGKNTVTFKNVIIGEVWVASGQSNMEFGMRGAHNASTEIPAANHPKIRLFTVKKKIAFEPQSDCQGTWVECTPETVQGFSAVAYFFARDLHKSTGLPVGMIHTSWGGTPAEAWTSLQALEAVPSLKYYADKFQQLVQNLPAEKEKFEKQAMPKFREQQKKWQDQYGKKYQEELKQWQEASRQARAEGKPAPPRPELTRQAPRAPAAPDNDPHAPTVLYNGMIAPLLPYAIRGAIWYQGESNAGKPDEYATLFPTMITDWRKHWDEGDFPFLFVQLANYMSRHDQPADTTWARLREAQLKTLSLPNTGMAVIIDIGQGNDIHPKDKMDVGHRLALAAEHVAYGKDVVYSGPTYDSMKAEGHAVRIHFKNAGAGLTIAAGPSTQPGVPQEKPASEIKGFAIAGPDKQFYWATAKIVSPDTVEVSSDKVEHPVAVRYAWDDNPAANLYNKEGLPASPFRTDDWPLKQQEQVRRAKAKAKAQ